MSRSYHIVVAALVLSACATHPTISPVPLKKGETYFGYSLSTENVMPIVFLRRGLTDVWDLGLRVGMPIYGSGVDISRLLVDRENRSDVLNLAYGLNPNHNIDLTYYRVTRKTKTSARTNLTRRRLRYIGLRGMVILSGIGGGRSTRFGILVGGAPAVTGDDPEHLPRFHRFQWEIGYYHDFNSMPLRAVFDLTPFDDQHDLWEKDFADYPHLTSAGFPSEHSRLTGISLRITFPLVRPAPGAPEEEVEE
ncbi:MAG: hypothetical protein V3U35_08915 [Candidatus Neomarinimicrobiota bacterium]